MSDTVKVVATLLCVRAGVTREIVLDVEAQHRDSQWGMWTTGNYSCDCNRHLFFEEAAGCDPGEDYPCGETAYKLLRLTIDGKDEPI